jgi:hypothetical protein
VGEMIERVARAVFEELKRTTPRLGEALGARERVVPGHHARRASAVGGYQEVAFRMNEQDLIIKHARDWLVSRYDEGIDPMPGILAKLEDGAAIEFKEIRHLFRDLASAIVLYRRR